MVCVCIAGGRLSQDIQNLLDQAFNAFASGDTGRAVVLYREALSACPRHPDAMHMLGVIAQQNGESELALQLIDSALTSRPEWAQARINRSIVLRSLGRNQEAAQSIRAAVASSPLFAEAWDLLGQTLKDEGKYAEAIECFSNAIGLQPTNSRFYSNYALLLFAAGDLSAAYNAAAKAQELDSSSPPMLLGNILNAQGYPLRAAGCFARVRTLLPNFADASASEAMAWLRIGEMERGWKLWENRPDMAEALQNIPLWQGQHTPHLLLYEDQGLGDALQFMRYIPLLANKTGKTTLRISKALERLASENFPNIEIISEHPLPANIDARCRLSSLPFYFSTRLDNIPPIPYLKPAAHVPQNIPLKDMPQPRIGIVWAGNAKFHADATRSIAPLLLEPLFDCGRDHFISMQKDNGASCETPVLDAAPALQDFADTAALMSSLDLIISVDTASAHLAGALGKPVWILLPFNSDWRWMMGREDSPWYPTARLFRQPTPGDWPSVIKSVTADLFKFLGSDKSVLSPKHWNSPPLSQHPNAIPME